MKRPIVILHGWGLKGVVYKHLMSLLNHEGYTVYAPDLPGFGDTPLVNNYMKLDNYVFFLKQFAEKNSVKKAILIGHSFGGRVAIKFTYKFPQKVSKLILTGVPVMRDFSLKTRIAFFLAVVGGKLFENFPSGIKELFRKGLYRAIGEWDYYNAGKLKQVFKNIVGEGLVQYIKEIKTPILFVWGENDHVVPAPDLKKFKDLATEARVVIVPNTNHGLPCDTPDLFLKAIKSFL